MFRRVLEMEEANKAESHSTSAAAFVEGGVQDACDDACSICLEEFCQSDPSALTNCRHEFHLQCILEWCQRSTHCPMCWQSISLKDPSSQELLEAVERERSFRATQRNATIFNHHPALGGFELQHVGGNDAELEEQIMHHLAAAAAMGRAHHFGRREGQRIRSSGHGRPHFLMFSAHPGAPLSVPVSSSGGGDNTEPAVAVATTSSHIQSSFNESLQRTQNDYSSSLASGSNFMRENHGGTSYINSGSTSHSLSANEDEAGPSDFQSFSESVKSKFNAMSMRYKESFSKSTRGWKERLFSRNTSLSDIGAEVRREVSAGISGVSHLMERLESREDGRAGLVSIANNLADGPGTQQSNLNNAERQRENTLTNSNITTTCAASAASS